MNNRDILLEMTKTLGIIMEGQNSVKEDIKGLQSDMSVVKTNCYNHGNKICAMESGLNNHLTAHNSIRKYFFWPMAVSFSVGGVVVLLKLIFHVW